MQKVVILGTGGTIAGTANDPSRAWAYQAAQLSVAQLIEAVPALQGVPLEAVQVAQVDSKDMSWSIWRQLGRALHVQLARDDVAGVVITHGTDTLEETACLLQALHDGAKPVVLTAAMYPATSPDADGPGNLRDAVRVVQESARRCLGGVVAVMHGRVWSAIDVRKAHSHALDAFDGGGASPLVALAQDDRSEAVWPSAWPACGRFGWGYLEVNPPRVEIVCSHADADGWLVRAMLGHAQHSERPLRGIVVAGTGHGTLHEGLAQALREATQQGITVWRSSRVARGGVLAREGDEWRAVPHLTAAQARVALTLSLLGADHAG
ncbi:asparaginase [Aquabacterium sp.]|uniref:asparaginase n=1 Tax=Aquabacterium sp. TaxID=1872578 RepID=UPI003BAF2331